MKSEPIDAAQLKTIISEMKSFSVLKMLIPVSWGFWNIVASIICIIDPSLDKIIWIFMVGIALLCHVTLFYIAKKKQGYELKVDTVYKWIWLFIAIAMIELCFIFPEIIDLYNRDYTLVFVVLIVGTGWCITGKLHKENLLVLLGLTWIVTSNIILVKIQYVYHIYGILAFVTLIVVPLILYLINRKRK